MDSFDKEVFFILREMEYISGELFTLIQDKINGLFRSKTDYIGHQLGIQDGIIHIKQFQKTCHALFNNILERLEQLLKDFDCKAAAESIVSQRYNPFDRSNSLCFSHHNTCKTYKLQPSTDDQSEASSEVKGPTWNFFSQSNLMLNNFYLTEITYLSSLKARPTSIKEHIQAALTGLQHHAQKTEYAIFHVQDHFRDSKYISEYRFILPKSYPINHIEMYVNFETLRKKYKAQCKILTNFIQLSRCQIMHLQKYLQEFQDHLDWYVKFSSKHREALSLIDKIHAQNSTPENALGIYNPSPLAR